VLRLGVPPTLARTLRSTNAIESMISVCREHAGNVKRWRDGQMAQRWSAAATVTCTCPHSAPHSNSRSPNLSDPWCTMIT
jgi:hypothetical protein